MQDLNHYANGFVPWINPVQPSWSIYTFKVKPWVGFRNHESCSIKEFDEWGFHFAELVCDNVNPIYNQAKNRDCCVGTYGGV